MDFNYRPTNRLMSPADVLAERQALQAGQQKNALMQFQLQSAQAEALQRNALMQQQAQQAQAQSRMLNDLAGNMGPPQELNPAAAMLVGFKPEQIKALQGPAPRAPVVMGPGASLVDPQSGKPLFTNPFKPEAPRLPPIGELQQFRDSMPQGDPRRREVQALIDNQTRPPKFAGGGSAPAPRTNTQPVPGAAPGPDSRRQLATELGVPLADRDPFANMQGPQADIFKRNLYQQADKKLNEMDEAASTARNMARDMQRFLQLQQRVGMQGPIAGRVMALSSEAQEMDAITDKITPQMRQPGSGATSDFDAKMFRNSTVSRTKNEQANEAIGQAVILQTQNTSDRAQFMRDYLTVNGHLDGADRQWARYLNSNPIFDPKSPDVPRLNAARVPYQQFFGAQGAAPAPQAAPAAGGRLTPEEQRELDELRRRFPRGAQ